MEKKNIKYICAIPIGIKVAYSMYKFFHGPKYLQCSEMFIIRKFSMNMVLRKFVYVVNVVLKKHIQWPQGEELVQVMVGFRKSI